MKLDPDVFWRAANEQLWDASTTVRGEHEEFCCCAISAAAAGKPSLYNPNDPHRKWFEALFNLGVEPWYRYTFFGSVDRDADDGKYHYAQERQQLRYCCLMLAYEICLEEQPEVVCIKPSSTSGKASSPSLPCSPLLAQWNSSTI